VQRTQGVGRKTKGAFNGTIAGRFFLIIKRKISLTGEGKLINFLGCARKGSQITTPPSLLLKFSPTRSFETPVDSLGLCIISSVEQVMKQAPGNLYGSLHTARGDLHVFVPWSGTQIGKHLITDWLEIQPH
jgi:hypothetical protein